LPGFKTSASPEKANLIATVQWRCPSPSIAVADILVAAHRSVT
jgi:hypothetical protein